MKRATFIVMAVFAYWMVRVVSAPAPAPEDVASTIEELQVLESTQHAGGHAIEWNDTLEERGEITDGL